MRDFILVIPARLESTRLPRKLLIKVEGKTIIERTFNCALRALKQRDKIFIATDSIEIEQHCISFGANVVLTSNNCLTGTDRVAEVADKIKAKQYINLQGDEPIFPEKELNFFINEAIKYPNDVSTAVTKIKNEDDYRNLSIPKMVFSNSKKLLYSSRASIPSNKKNFFKEGYKHVCIYAFNNKHLKAFENQPEKTYFEFIEDLEINRFLELDIPVNCIELNESGKAIDTPEDLRKLENLLRIT